MGGGGNLIFKYAQMFIGDSYVTLLRLGFDIRTYVRFAPSGITRKIKTEMKLKKKNSPLAWFDALEHTVVPASRRPKKEMQHYSQYLPLFRTRE